MMETAAEFLHIGLLFKSTRAEPLKKGGNTKPAFPPAQVRSTARKPKISPFWPLTATGQAAGKACLSTKLQTYLLKFYP